MTPPPAPPPIPTGTLVRAMFMDAVLICGGLALFLATGQPLWAILGAAAGAVVLFVMIVAPRIRAARAARDGRLVE